MIEKATYVVNADTTVAVPGGQNAIEVVAVALKASTDASVSCAITDKLARAIATWPSADYTTRNRKYFGALEAGVFDAAGDASVSPEGQMMGVIADDSLTFTVGATVGTGDLTIEVYYKPLFRARVVMDALNLAATLDMPSAISFLKAARIQASVDATVDLIITDTVGTTLQTWASADYTAGVGSFRAIGPTEDQVMDTANVAGADTQGTLIGVIVEGSLVCTSTTLVTGTLTVDAYVEE